LNSRERVLTALAHREPDRVPIDIGTSDTFIAREVYEGIAAALGIEPVAAAGVDHPGAFVTPDETMLQLLGADVRLVPVKAIPGGDPAERGVREELLPDGTVQWSYPDGHVLQRLCGESDTQVSRPAIVDDLTQAEIDRIYPPNPAVVQWCDAEPAQAEIAQWHRLGKAVQCNQIIMPVTGTSANVLDFTSWCMALATEPELLCKLMDRYLEHAYARAESFYTAVGTKMDLVYGLGDDVAMHMGLWMSPQDYRRYIKPRHQEIIRFIKERTQAKIIFHCCGACRELISDYIEIGVDVLNPTQTSATGMDPFELKREFGNDITFWGGIDVMHLLPRGTPAEVEREVKRHIDALAPGGGYVFAPSHIILRYTPPENVVTMYRTAAEYGRY